MTRWFVICLLVACGGTDIPTAPELYGHWTGTADGSMRDFVFAEMPDASHTELAGMTDVYVISRDGSVVQSGHYSIEERLVTGHGTTDALVTVDVATGMTYGNAILDYTGSSLTISSESASAGKLVLGRAD